VRTHALLFPDSNVFLQCKALPELPWSDLLQADNIDLLIGTPVQDEIDRLKNDGNARRARRARDTNSLFRQVLASPDEAVTIREQGPRIVLRFSPPLPPERDSVDSLDLKRFDDRLIDEVMHVRRTAPAAQILSDDTGMILRCRRHGVPALAVPESWLLPPEKDERDKQIGALKAENLALRSGEATLSLALEDGDGRALDSISGQMPLYADLTKVELAALLEDFERWYPEVKDIGREPSQPETGDVRAFGISLQPLFGWQPPTAEEIQAYRTRYAGWIETLRERIKGNGQLLGLTHRVRKVHLLLGNTGSRPADEVLLELAAHGGVTFLAGVGDEIPHLIRQVNQFEREAQLPAPPVPPRGEYLHERITRNSQLSFFGERGLGRNIMGDLSSVVPKFSQQDRHEYYRREDADDPATIATFGCQEFRHQRDPQRFSLWLIVPAQAEPVRGRLHVRVSARNMANLQELHIPIDVHSEVRPAYAIAVKWRVEEKPE
jgi:hypothetical protein